MNPNQPVTQEQLVGLLRLIAIVGSNPKLLKEVTLIPRTNGIPKISPATQFNYESNLKTIRGLAIGLNVLK